MKKKPQLTARCFAHFPDGHDDLLENLTAEQRKHLVIEGTKAFFEPLGIIATPIDKAT